MGACRLHLLALCNLGIFCRFLCRMPAPQTYTWLTPPSPPPRLPPILIISTGKCTQRLLSVVSVVSDVSVVSEPGLLLVCDAHVIFMGSGCSKSSSSSIVNPLAPALRPSVAEPQMATERGQKTFSPFTQPEGAATANAIAESEGAVHPLAPPACGCGQIRLKTRKTSKALDLDNLPSLRDGEHAGRFAFLVVCRMLTGLGAVSASACLPPRLPALSSAGKGLEIQPS